MKHNAFTLAEDMQNSKLKFGFTLSEILITLGIIGVVSALTLPTLMKNHQRQVYVTQLHKVYNELAQAAEQLKTDSNVTRLGESRLRRQGSGYLLNHYFKTTKTCNNDNLTDCFGNDYQNMNGDDVSISNFVPANSACAIIASGASICVSGTSYLEVVTDINGKQGPNIVGRDLFSLIIWNNGTVTTKRDPSDADDNFIDNCTKGVDAGEYGTCLAKIISDGWKMDY